MTTGGGGSAAVPGAANAGVLALEGLGTKSADAMMPPSQLLSREDVDTILAWIEGGATK